MDTNTIVAISVNGFLITFFIYALLYVFRMSPSKTVEPLRPEIRAAMEPPIPEVSEVIEPSSLGISEVIGQPRPEVMEVTEIMEPPRPEVREVTEVIEPPIPEVSEVIEPSPEISEVIEPSSLEISKVIEPSSPEVSEVMAPPKPEVTDTPKPSQNIIHIEGIGLIYAETLKKIGIETTNDLLLAGTTPQDREELAKKTGVSPNLILEWVNLVDLLRIKGVSEEYSDLLEEAGVDTVVELAKRNPEKLYNKMKQVNEEKNLVNRAPFLSEVLSWVEQARALPRKLEY